VAAEGDARQIDAFLRAEVRHLAGESRGPVEPQRAGWTCEGHLSRIRYLDFKHRVGGDRCGCIARLLLDDRRVGDLQMTTAVTAGMEVRRGVMADQVDGGQHVTPARDFQHSAIRRAGRIADGRARGVNVDEVNELAAVAAEAGHLARVWSAGRSGHRAALLVPSVGSVSERGLISFMEPADDASVTA